MTSDNKNSQLLMIQKRGRVMKYKKVFEIRIISLYKGFYSYTSITTESGRV